MLAFMLRRTIQSVVVLFVMSLLVFCMINLVGDPVDMLVNPESLPDEIERVRRDFGLDQPVYVQYWEFLKGALSGDLGNSYVFGRPALTLMAERFPATLELAVCALIIAVMIGLPLGIYSGLRPDGWPARIIMSLSVLGISIPTFWLGLMMIIVFSVILGWLPVSGRGETGVFLGIESSIFTLDGLQHLIMPATNLALFKIAMVMRLARAGTVEVMAQDFIRFARAKGLPSKRIVRSHLLPNILIPIVTVVGIEFGTLIAFATVTESIFSWPGLGKLVIDAIVNLDRPVVVAYLLFVVALFLALNLIVDIIYAALDPRVRLQGDDG
ncbi:MAG TPA: ABC transporter permease [Alphaproteobacteria bacterium]|nr:ABC transporter permease [Alphaproteobacteria bacterium]